MFRGCTRGEIYEEDLTRAYFNRRKMATFCSTEFQHAKRVRHF